MNDNTKQNMYTAHINLRAAKASLLISIDWELIYGCHTDFAMYMYYSPLSLSFHTLFINNYIYTSFMHTCDAFVIKTNVCVNVCFVLHLFEFYILFVLVLCKLVQWFYYTLLAIRFITSSTYLYKIYILACVMYWFN